MQKMSVGKMVNLILGVVAFAALILTGLNSVFKWDWNTYFVAVTTVVVGLYLVISAGVKNFKSIVMTAWKTRITGMISLVLFGFGLLVIYVGIITLPFAGGLPSPTLKFNGWVRIIGGALALADAFNWLPRKNS